MIFMKLIIGLGNPGEKYQQTRHNVGFVFVEALQKKYKFPDFSYNKKFFADIAEGCIECKKIILVKPQTFMNHSGKSVQALIDFYKITPHDIIVVHDDLDIEIGDYKVSTDTRAAGHNGVQNIIDTLGTQDFVRIRIGAEKLGGRSERGKISGEKFVLAQFDDDESTALQNVCEKIMKKPPSYYYNM